MEELTKENYITDHSFLSFTTFSKFQSCEASAAAHYKEKTSDAMLMSSYVDAYFSDELEDFKEKKPEIFNSRTGELKKDFIQANEIIERIKSDDVMMHFMSGKKQVIMTGEIDGVKVKIKMDSYKENEFITDLKVMKDFSPVWTGNGKSSFIIAYNYDIELALFQEVVFQRTGKRVPCYICGITKETPSDVAIFKFTQKQLDEALKLFKSRLPRIKNILEGKVAPHRCEKCEYCRLTKKAMIIDSEFAGYNGDMLRENGIECDDKIIEKKEENNNE